MLARVESHFHELHGASCYLYGVIHHDNPLARNFYPRFGAVDREWHPDVHPEFTREEGFLGLTYDLKPDVCEHLVLVVFGQENPSAIVGIEEDKKTIKSYFGKYKSADCRALDAVNTTFDELKDYLKDKKSSGIKKLVLIYSGHGANVSGKYPSFTMKSGVVALTSIFDYCKSLDFAMAIVGGDCCNVIPIVSADSGRKRAGSFRSIVHPFSAQGHILFASSKVGQPSYGGQQGGAFMSHFFANFDGDWSGTLTTTRDYLSSKLIYPQTPDWDIAGFTQHIPKYATQVRAESSTPVGKVTSRVLDEPL